MKGASFCIHGTCLCHWVFELPLSHLSKCTAIHFIFITLGCWMPLFPPQLRLYRPRVKLKILRVNYVLTRMSDVAISKDQQLLTHVFFYNLKASFLVLVLVLIMPVLTDVSFAWYVSHAKKCLSLFSPVPPSIHEIKSHGIGMGRLPLLRCEAAAVPPPTFEWYKGEKRWAWIDCLSCVSWFTLLIGCIQTACACAGVSVVATMSTRSQR